MVITRYITNALDGVCCTRPQIKRATCVARMRRMEEEQIIRVAREVCALLLGSGEGGGGNMGMTAATASGA